MQSSKTSPNLTLINGWERKKDVVNVGIHKIDKSTLNKLCNICRDLPVIMPMQPNQPQWCLHPLPLIPPIRQQQYQCRHCLKWRAWNYRLLSSLLQIVKAPFWAVVSNFRFVSPSSTHNMANKWNSGGSTSHCFTRFINSSLDEALLLYQDDYVFVLSGLCFVSFENPSLWVVLYCFIMLKHDKEHLI